MSGKYDPLIEYLRSRPADERVEVNIRAIDRMVGGLPPSAHTAMWWSNTPEHSQALAWLSLGRRARADLEEGRVVFTAANHEPPQRLAIRVAPRTPSIMSGVAALDEVLRRAGYSSVAAAVAEHTVFIHPRTVEQTGGQPVFPTIRDMIRRGQMSALPDGRPILLDDNTTPTWAFLWAAGRGKGLDVQYNHVWTDSQNPLLYTALWNLCATPAFLAKTTDGQNHPEVGMALRFRSYQLYGSHPTGESQPEKPEGFDVLRWAPMPDPVASLEETYRARLGLSPKSRMATAAREIGWLFSGWKPDASLTVAAG